MDIDVKDVGTTLIEKICMVIFAIVVMRLLVNK